MLRSVLGARVLRKMPAPKKARRGPKLVKKAPPKPKPTMLQIRQKYLEELPPLPYLPYPDERCYIEKYQRPLLQISKEEEESRVEILKEYTRHMNRTWKSEKLNYEKQVELRRRALHHLRESSEELYNHAKAFNFDVFPIKVEGLKETISNEQHVAPLKKEYEMWYNEESIATNNHDTEESQKLTIKERRGDLSASIAETVSL